MKHVKLVSFLLLMAASVVLAIYSEGAAASRGVISIDRSTPIDPKLVGSNSSDWTCDWVVDEEDPRVLEITQLKPQDIVLQDSLIYKNETTGRYPTGEEVLLRVRAVDCIHLDAKVFSHLNLCQRTIPYEWGFLTNKDGTPCTRIYFWGTVFKSKRGSRFILCLIGTRNDVWYANHVNLKEILDGPGKMATLVP